MEIVLIKDHEALGKAMDVLTVKDGFARNFLIPSGIAVIATAGNKKRLPRPKSLTRDAKRRSSKSLARWPRRSNKSPAPFR